jgi:hypothetical protein
MFPS